VFWGFPMKLVTIKNPTFLPNVITGHFNQRVPEEGFGICILYDTGETDRYRDRYDILVVEKKYKIHFLSDHKSTTFKCASHRLSKYFEFI